MIEKVRCSCGAVVSAEIPDDLREPWKESLRRMMVCARCIARNREADAAEREAKAARGLWSVVASRMRASGVPKELQRVDWSDLGVDAGNRAAIAAAKRWAAFGIKGVVLTGAVGVGKTTIAAAAAIEHLGHGPLRWTSMPRLFALLGIGGNDTNRRIASELLTGTGALVLDDLDKARPSDYGAEIVFGVIDNRIVEGAPLFVTMNLDYPQLAIKFPEPYGEAIASRLVGYCGNALEVRGRDRRLPEPARIPGMEGPAAA